MQAVCIFQRKEAYMPEKQSNAGFRPIDAGTLAKSYCSSFQPSDFSRENLIYMTWCGHYYCTDQYGMNRESFPENLLLYVRKGQMDVQYQGKTYLMDPGDLLIMNCRYPHMYHAHNAMEFVYLHYEGLNSRVLTDYLIEQNGGPILKCNCNLDIGNALYENARKFKEKRIQNLMETHFWINDLLRMISRDITPEIKEGTPIDKVVQYIMEHVGEEISLDDLSEITSFNKYYLSHLFKKQTGYTIAEFILSTRLQKAEHLLLHSNRSVEDIAFEVGYSHSSSFINIFTSRVGFSPKQYRKNRLGGQS